MLEKDLGHAPPLPKSHSKVRFASDDVLVTRYENPIEPGPIYEQLGWSRRLVVENEEDPDPLWGASWNQTYAKLRPEQPARFKTKWTSKWQLFDRHP